MFGRLKRWLYFPVARYFRFWAGLKLRRWRPRIILVTGSSGKTTLLHLLEAQIGDRAHYSHFANSSFGLPFDILGFPKRQNNKREWLVLILAAPFKAFSQPRPQPFYIVEADSDRPGEAAFIAGFLRPEVVIWLSSDRSHSANFDRLVTSGQAPSARAAVAAEFASYIETATKLVILNADSELIMGQADRTTATIEPVSSRQIKDYSVGPGGTTFAIDGQQYHLPAAEPEETGRSIAAVAAVCDYLGVKVDRNFPRFVLPPGRSSILAGTKQTTLIDSSYNAIPDAMRAILNLFAHYPGTPKWVVIGDMTELGRSEASEHEKLADEIANLKLARIILMGPRVARYTAPALRRLIGKSTPIEVFTEPRPALDYLETHIKGGEIILFKGARFLEGVIEHLLADPADAAKLCRREASWQRWRARWGL